MKTFILILFLVTSNSFALSTYFKSFKKTYPNFDSPSCAICHDHAPPKLNYYGMDFQKANYDFKAIESLDSDGDSIVNLEEINKNTNPGDKTEH